MRNSIKYKIVSTVVLIMLPLLLTMNFSNIYYLNLLREKSAQSNSVLTSLYMDQIDIEINKIDNYLSNIFASNSDLLDIDNKNERIRFYANYRLADKLKKDITIYDIADFIFIYSLNYDYYIYSYADNTYNQRILIKERIKLLAADGVDDEWQIVTIDGKKYLLKILTRNDVFLGAMIDFQVLAKPLESVSEINDAQYIFSDTDGNILTNTDFVTQNNISINTNHRSYYLTGTRDEYLITDSASYLADFNISVAVKDKSIFADLNSMQFIILVLSILSLFVLPILIWLIYKWIIVPVNKLKTGIKSIEKGNFDYKITDNKVADEFVELNNTFNSMSKEIKDLKIEVYEEIIENQRLELKYLQSQIKPHFLLNAMTTIANFAKLKQYRNMNEFISFLTNYIRYTFKWNISKVKIGDEIEHIHNYLSMQELRFFGSLVYVFDIDEKVENNLIPPFAIFTFVENIIKHAMKEENTINVFIRALPYGDDDGYVKIIVEDNGSGITENVVNQIKLKTEDDGKNIGINNVRKTLEIMYSGKASLNITSSNLSGTLIEILIPAE